MRTRGLRPFGALTVLLGLGALVAAPVAGAPPGDVKALAAELKKAVAAQAAEPIQAALEGLIDAGGATACEEVLEVIPKLGRAADGTYWQLVNAGAGFRDGPAQTFLGDWIVKHKKDPFARDLLFALENNASPFTVNALSQVLEKGPYDLQLMAADQLARVHTVEAVDALMAQLRKEGDKGDPELRRRIMTSLAAITGETMGDSVNWLGWWDANRKNGLPERAREGGGGGGGGLASQALDPNRKREFETMTRDPKRVVVISSRLPADDPKEPNADYNYDHMESILEGMKIAHTVVLKKEFEKDPQKYLRDAWTVLINCNNIQMQCICPECERILNEKARKGQNLGGTTNRLYTCPPECSRHDQISYRMTQATIDAIKRWVEQGGYLFTEDWGVVEVIEAAWPEIVRNSKQARSPDGTTKSEFNLIRQTDVTITPGRGLTSLPLLRGVFARPRPPAAKPEPEAGGDAGSGTRTRDLGEDNPATPPKNSWHIDDESPAVEIVDRAKVTVLIESEDLAKLCGGNEAVAVNFRYGNAPPRREGAGGGGRERVQTGGGASGGGGAGSSRGRDAWAEQLRGGSVLHCMSHFGKQQSRTADTFVIQNLILNFVMESNRQHQ